MAIYAKIVDGQVTETRNLYPLESDPILEPKLLAHGWLPIEDVAPTYDSITQYLGDETIDIQADKVVRSKSVVDYTPEELSTNLVAAQSSKMANLYANVKQFISTQPNGWPRYDDDLKLNIMNASMTAIAAGQAKPANCQAVETWIYTVQQAFFGLKRAITDAEDLATLNNDIDVSYDWFDINYGREGTTAADPAVSTDDLFA